MTLRTIFHPKSDALKFFNSESNALFFLNFKNLTLCIVFSSKSCILKKSKNAIYVVFTEYNEPKRDFWKAI